MPEIKITNGIQMFWNIQLMSTNLKVWHNNILLLHQVIHVITLVLSFHPKDVQPACS